MFSLSTKIDTTGFWYLIEVTQDCNFTLSYIVIGSGGRQSSGEISGFVADTGEWQFQAVDFPVLRVGITDLQIDNQTSGLAVAPKNQQPVDSLSRRRAIRTLASAVLAGGAMMLLPQTSSFGRTTWDERTIAEDKGTERESYSPYGDETAVFFRPY